MYEYLDKPLFDPSHQPNPNLTFKTTVIFFVHVPQMKPPVDESLGECVEPILYFAEVVTQNQK